MSTVILGANSREKTQETKCKREKKRLFNALADEQLLLELGELLFISFNISENGEAAVRGFGEFFAIFGLFIRFEY
jgi:hypothetical protein